MVVRTGHAGAGGAFYARYVGFVSPRSFDVLGAAPPAPALAAFCRPYNATDRGDRRPLGRGPSGVEDLLGNLREWTSTILRPYPYNSGDGREGFSGDGSVVVRGASHDDPAESLSVTRRRFYDRRGASAGHHFVGFRCATSEDLGGR